MAEHDDFSPYRAEDPFDWDGLLALIRAEFAYMEGRIDPPSSMHRLTARDLALQSVKGEVWVIGHPAVACAVLTRKGGVLYLGKLAVAAHARRQGLARRLVDQALIRARDMGLAAVELQVRVELVENQSAFARIGFIETARTAHEGYDRATSITMQKPVQVMTGQAH